MSENFKDYTAGDPAVNIQALVPEPTAWQAEFQLMKLAPAAIAAGVIDRIQTYYEQPQSAAMTAGIGFGLGIALTACATMGGRRLIYRTMGQCLSRYAVATAATDVLLRTAVPFMETWKTPAAVAEQSKQLGSSIGGMLADFSVMGLSGYLGGRVVMLGKAMLPGVSATQKNVEELVADIGRNYRKPQHSESHVLRNAKTGRLSWKEQDSFAFEADNVAEEISDAASSIDKAYKQWGARRNWPEVSGVLNPNMDALAISMRETPTIAFNPLTLAWANRSEITAIAAHELTHTDQTITTIRYFADKSGIKISATQAELVALKEALGSRGIPSEPTDEFIHAVLKFRNGEPLSKWQNRRIEAFLQDAEFTISTYRKLYEAYDFRNYIQHMQKLSGTGAYSFVYDNLTTNPLPRYENLSRALKVPDDVRQCLARLSEQQRELEMMWQQPVMSPEARNLYDEKLAQMLLRRNQKTGPTQSELDVGVVSKWLEQQVSLAEARVQGLLKKEYVHIAVEKEAFRVGNIAGWQQFSNAPGHRFLIGLSTGTTGDGLKALINYSASQLNK
jgi:hypothetical protein